MYSSSFVERIQSFLSLGKDFSKPVGLTVAAIALSTVSMGLTLGFVPSIFQETMQSIHTKVGDKKDVNSLDRESKEKLIKDLARRIEIGMKENNELRRDVMKLMESASSSEKFIEMLSKQRELAENMQSEIQAIGGQFPELLGDVKIIDENINEVKGTLSDVSKDVKDIKKAINPEIKEAHYVSYMFGVSLGAIGLIPVSKETLHDMKRVIDDVDNLAKALGLRTEIEMEIESIYLLEEKLNAVKDEEIIWQEKLKAIHNIRRISSLRLKKLYDETCSNYMDIGYNMGMLRLFDGQENAFELVLPIIDASIKEMEHLNLPEKYALELYELKSRVASAQISLEDFSYAVRRIPEEIADYLSKC